MSKNVTTFDLDMAYNILSRTKAKELKQLWSKKERDATGLFLIEGEKCVKDSLEAFKPRYLICTQSWIDKNPGLLPQVQDNILLTDRRGIEIVSSLSSLPEVIAVCEKIKEEQVTPRLQLDKLYLLLDEIQDPGNLGTIIRTCDWFGVYDIYASFNTADIYSPKVVQATMGSLSRVRVHYTDLKELVENNQDLKLIGAVLDGTPLEECKEIEGGMLLMGNEGRGISEELKKLIDISLTISPVNKLNHPDSLNVAISTAILLSHIRGRK